MRMKYLSIKRLAWLCMAALSAPVFTSCDMMTEDREDCPIGLYLNFKYDYNLERADMFNDHVGAVDVYVFDQDGKYVTKQSEANIGSSMPLADPTYTMHMDLDPGKYQFIVLAGQNTYAEQMEAGRPRFVRTEPQKGDDMKTLDIRLETTQQGNNMLLVDNHGLPLDTLWHGMEVEPVEVYAEKPTYHTISLMRDTKKINVTLREIDDPTQMDINNYDLRITDRNAHILWDNSLDETDWVVYTPHATWNTDDRTPALDANGNEMEELGQIGHADFMTSRILYHDDAADDGRLTITNKVTGQEVATLNLPDILSRLRTSEDIYRYSAQEFLDRGYDYQLDIFLKGDRLAYINISISVLGWSKRIQFEEL